MSLHRIGMGNPNHTTCNIYFVILSNTNTNSPILIKENLRKFKENSGYLPDSSNISNTMETPEKSVCAVRC